MTQTQPDSTAYRGYSIRRSPFDGLWRVSKDGFCIFTAETLAAAKTAIDEVAS